MEKTFSDQMLTGSTTAKKMTKTEIKEEKMFAIRERIEKTVRPLAEICFKYEDSVNETTVKEKGFAQIISTPDFIIRNYVTELCDKIMLSRMSADDKVDMLNRLDILVDYANYGGYLTAYSEDENDWDRLVRHNADLRIAEHTGRRGRNKK